LTYIQPGLTLLVLLLLWAWRTADVRKKNRRILFAAILLFLWSWAPAGWVAVRTLEAGFSSQPPPASSEAAAIVVASGGAEIVTQPAYDVRLTDDTNIRIRYAAWLYHHWKAVPILVSGGKIVEAPPGTFGTLAAAMAQALQDLGVPASDILQETEATSTHENAIFSARMLKSKGIDKVAVVTEAYHIRRTAATFANAGLSVVPAPCGFRGIEPPHDISSWFPSARGLRLNEAVLHEWVGLAWYKLRGRM